jgi:hypothetical protein
MSDPTHCVVQDGGQCQAYFPGHNTHWIHAKHVGRTPWGWRDAVVRTIDGCALTVAYVDSGHEVELWHHDALAGELAVGVPVRLHEQYSVLGGPFGWLHVVVRDGLGSVPEPTDTTACKRAMTGGVQDLGTGRALALDWPDPEDHR